MSADRTWAIGDLNRRARLAVVKEFRGRIWVYGELARLEERRGNRFLELVERGGGRDGRDAHLDAFCSATRWQWLVPKLAEAGVALGVGQRLVVAGQLELGDRGKLSLAVDDVDVAALVGDRLRARQELVRQLIADDLFDANRRLVLARLPLRVGVVASAGSDGHRDLMRRLERSGFAFDVTLRSIPVEGPAAPRSIRAALATFGPDDVDVVAVVRGGGAKASLDVFDQPPVAHAVATAMVPVWTGIGHTGDRTVADEVAHRSFATPTAVAEELVAAVAGAREAVVEAVAAVGRLVERRLVAATGGLESRRRELVAHAGSQLARHAHAHARTAAELRRGADRSLAGGARDLAGAAHAVRTSGVVELREARRQLDYLAADLSRAARTTCLDAGDDLAVAARAVAAGAAATLAGAGRPIAAAVVGLHPDRLRRRLDDHADRAASRRAVLDASDPRRRLASGWTLTRTASGGLVSHVAGLEAGDVLVTTFASGRVRSTVAAVEENPRRG